MSREKFTWRIPQLWANLYPQVIGVRWGMRLLTVWW
jgi:hypothetical protein